MAPPASQAFTAAKIAPQKRTFKDTLPQVGFKYNRHYATKEKADRVLAAMRETTGIDVMPTNADELLAVIFQRAAENAHLLHTLDHYHFWNAVYKLVPWFRNAPDLSNNELRLLAVFLMQARIRAAFNPAIRAMSQQPGQTAQAIDRYFGILESRDLQPGTPTGATISSATNTPSTLANQSGTTTTTPSSSSTTTTTNPFRRADPAAAAKFSRAFLWKPTIEKRKVEEDEAENDVSAGPSTSSPEVDTLAAGFGSLSGLGARRPVRDVKRRLAVKDGTDDERVAVATKTATEEVLGLSDLFGGLGVKAEKEEEDEEEEKKDEFVVEEEVEDEEKTEEEVAPAPADLEMADDGATYLETLMKLNLPAYVLVVDPENDNLDEHNEEKYDDESGEEYSYDGDAKQRTASLKLTTGDKDGK
ncbi:hypothetical protein GE09DRAFT_1293628 [Coniochaeta sp. 2T2.1]|nr:hypothetical protein GE09DRAFT_1293628 [Coniochaeta sp. 2T2.1]